LEYLNIVAPSFLIVIFHEWFFRKGNYNIGMSSVLNLGTEQLILKNTKLFLMLIFNSCYRLCRTYSTTFFLAKEQTFHSMLPFLVPWKGAVFLKKNSWIWLLSGTYKLQVYEYHCTKIMKVLTVSISQTFCPLTYPRLAIPQR